MPRDGILLAHCIAINVIIALSRTLRTLRCDVWSCCVRLFTFLRVFDGRIYVDSTVHSLSESSFGTLLKSRSLIWCHMLCAPRLPDSRHTIRLCQWMEFRWVQHDNHLVLLSSSWSWHAWNFLLKTSFCDVMCTSELLSLYSSRTFVPSKSRRPWSR
jgi:hypothetical protein